MNHDGIISKPTLDELYNQRINQELEHGWLKDQAAKVHKYIRRWRGKNGKWYYEYKEKAKSKINNIIEKGKESKIYKKIKKTLGIKDDAPKGSMYENDKRFKWKPEHMRSDLLKNKTEKKYKYYGRVKTSYGYRYFYSKLEYDKYMNRYKNIIAQDDDPNSIKNLKRLAKPETIRESVKKVNPNYDNGENIPYAINCQRCAMSFEMRQRGFDVEAGANPSGFSPLSPKYNTEHSYDSLFEIATYLDVTDKNFELKEVMPSDRKTNNKYSNPEKDWFDKQMKNMPKESRGFLTVYWDIGRLDEGVVGGGHIVNWCKDSYGNVRIVDSQTGDVYTPEKFYEKPACYSKIMRTDNVPIIPDFVDRFSMDENEDDIFLNRRKGK